MKKFEVRKEIPSRCPPAAKILYFLAAVSLPLHVSFYLSAGFADWYNKNIGSIFRMILAKFTNILPFSLAETVVLTLPLFMIGVIVYVARLPKEDTFRMTRMTCTLAAVLCFLYAAFVLGFASTYRGNALEKKLGFEKTEITTDKLFDTAKQLQDGMDEELDEIEFRFASFSVMPYSLDELNDKLNDAYSKAAEKYGFVKHFPSNVKYVLHSEPMTYTHISGVYSFFTGEANINVNFPDYTIPYTTAHELSHQRGIGPEDEANFMAFLVCLESDDPYIRYSGYLSVYEYVTNALYRADKERYYDLTDTLDPRIRYEMIAYSDFFEEYRESTASKVTGTVNDTFLKSQGQQAGTLSYDLVTELAVAYYCGE